MDQVVKFLQMSGNWVTSARRAAAVLAVIAVAGCAAPGDDSLSYVAGRSAPNQPFPANYRPELIAFLKTYLNNPGSVRQASVATPVQRPVRGRDLYVACLRFNMRGTDGRFTGVKERAVLYIDGRLDRMLEEPGDLCANVNYAPFPELEKLAP
jgi:hypothetical protein